MHGEDLRRKSDAILTRLEQKLDDHIQRFDRFEIEISDKINKHMAWAESEKIALATRISTIEIVWKSIEKPVKIVGWAVTIFFAVLITSLASHLTEWFKSHWSK